jgi:hypothetical protein
LNRRTQSRTGCNQRSPMRTSSASNSPRRLPPGREAATSHQRSSTLGLIAKRGASKSLRSPPCRHALSSVFEEDRIRPALIRNFSSVGVYRIGISLNDLVDRIGRNFSE